MAHTARRLSRWSLDPAISEVMLLRPVAIIIVPRSVEMARHWNVVRPKQARTIDPPGRRGFSPRVVPFGRQMDRIGGLPAPASLGAPHSWQLLGLPRARRLRLVAWTV